MDEVRDVVKDDLHDLLKREKNLSYQKTSEAWEKIVGPKASAHTKIVHLTKDRIQVNVDSSAWLYELSLKKESIQKEINKKCKIQEVRFKLGSISV